MLWRNLNAPVCAKVLTGWLLYTVVAMAQAPTDDLTTMTPEQRREYLENYLKRLSMPAPESVVPAPAPSTAVLPSSNEMSEGVKPSANVSEERVDGGTTDAALPQPVPDVSVPSQAVVQSPDGAVYSNAGLNCADYGKVKFESPFVRRLNNGDIGGNTRWITRSELATDGRFVGILQEQDAFLLEQRCSQDLNQKARLGRVQISEGSLKVEFSEKLSTRGGVIVPVADGFLLDQKGSILDYRVGRAPRSVRLPPGYRLAEFQHSDVSTSRVVLLLSTSLLKASNPFRDLADLFRIRGRASEVSHSDSRYPAVLFHLETGKVWFVGFDADALSVVLRKRCDADAWTSSGFCGSLQDDSLLFSRNSTREPAAYFWRAGWSRSLRGFDLWFFDPATAEVTVSQAESATVRRQTMPLFVRGVWWRPDSMNPTLVIDTAGGEP